ncbi:coadhesin-like [Ruditapes philippinarum]|uniref:coadhesin-like n=1 Tax=Ruditapes philippinarum TaxID=129788 RepID=UPI00295B8465|nr:coadhesin-like [Ruditapes philippinarum]
MTGKYIYSCFLLFLFQAAGSKATLVCNKCNSSESLEKCHDVIQCGNEQSCFTEIQTKDEQISYTMGCTDNQNCGEIPEYDSVSKLNSLPIKKCYECCQSKGCNYHLCNHPTPSKCQDDKRMDCAKLNEMFDICKDIHDAKLVCPKFCKLCKLVDGNWADWSQWSACDVTCGNGKHNRFRSCTNPAPKYQGLECEGEKIDSKHCQRPLCPVHGGWSSWSNWSACPVTCGIGMQKRLRNCSNPYPLRYGDHCFGDPLEFKICFEKLCDGGVWGSWDEWGSCSASCDSGIRKRSRSCSNLVGTICSGNSLDVQLCNIHDCPCRTLPTLRNGVLKLQLESSSNITYNIICNDGYQVSGQNYSICDKKSGWNDASNCDTVSCGKPVTPSNGRLVFASGITFNSIATFECLSSFSAFGNPISTCLRDGTWSKTVTCISPVSMCTKKTTYNTSFSNVALGKQVKLSSKHSLSTSMTDGRYDTYVHTLFDLNPFAVIDLGQQYAIVSFYVVNSKDCCVNRLRNVVIQVGDELSSLTTVVRQRGGMGTVCMFKLEKPIRGRFVKVMMEATEYLHIAELEVYSKTNN